jgi:hypothetical protein
MARGWHDRRERRSFRTWRDGSQLAQRVRPVLGDFCVVGKPLQTARQFFRSRLVADACGAPVLRRSGTDRPAGHGNADPCSDLLHAIEGHHPGDYAEPLHSRPLHQAKRAGAWWLVRVRRAELLRICCASGPSGTSTEASCGWSCAATGCIWRCVTPAPGCCGWLPPTLTPRGAAGCGWSSSSPPPGGSTATPTAARSSGAPSSFNHPGEFYPRAVICEARPRRRRSESGWTHRRVACSFPDAMGLSPGSCPWSSAAWRRQGLLRIGAGETNIA